MLPPLQDRLGVGEIRAQRQEILVAPREFLNGVSSIRKAGDGGEHALIHGMATLALR